MQRGVHAHAGIAFVPIDHRGDGVADLERRRAGCGHMGDLGLGGVGIDGCLDRNTSAVAVVSAPVSPGCPPDVA